MRFFLAQLITLALALTAATANKELFEKIDPFLSNHCFDCHDDTITKGGLDLTALKFEPWKKDNAETWTRIYDRIHHGEMPPEKKPRPKKEDIHKVLANIKPPLANALTKQQLKKGRVEMRRLTAREYEFSMQDLLGVGLPLRNHVPAEIESTSFDTVTDTQQISHFHLQRYLSAADLALDHAFDRLIKGDTTFKKHSTTKDLTKNWRRGNYRGPELIGNKSVAWNMGLQFYGRLESTKVPEDGWYQITVHNVQAINPKNGQSIWGVLRRGIGHSYAPTLYPVGLIEASSKPKNITYQTWMEKDHQLILKVDGDLTQIKRAPQGGRSGSISYADGRDRVKMGFQGIANTGITVERIYPNASHDNLRLRLIGKTTLDDLRNTKDPKKKREKIDSLVNRFATLAFRRADDWEVSEPYRKIARDTMDSTNGDIVRSLKAAYRTILCSPRFLGVYENPGKLDDDAIATRLSLMLWSSVPDWTLIDLAREGKLSQSDTLHQQIDRMLEHPRGKRFIKNFTDQWLDLDQIDFTSPDTRLYPTYDATVQQSILNETRRFVTELIEQDLPVTNIIQSDFAILNERLARYYDFKGVSVKSGSGFQKVKLPANPARSGLVSQAAILKVTADGTVTSPIVRGVWMNERILGRHIPPPPPGIPAVEPDIRGAVSIRDQLDKHRSNESCAGCHAKFDPAGFAFENFDPVGLWRTKYGKGNKGKPVDPSGTTPEGQDFPGISVWKSIYKKQPDRLARNLANQLITYGTGAPIRFSDRPSLDTIVAKSKKSGYGVRSLIHHVIASKPFLYK